MPNRQSLTELQERLAKRLQAARAEDSSHAWLAAETGGLALLFPLAYAGEIYAWSGVHPVPHAKAWYLGVANLRGSIQGVIDVLAFIQGGAVGRASVPDRLTTESRLVSLNQALGVNAVLLVDRLRGLRKPSDFARADPPAEGWPECIKRQLVDQEGKAWSEVDMLALSKHAEFLAIVA
jgi:twitching motility protein PilI